MKTKREACWSETKGCPQRPEGSSCKRILVFLTFYSASFGSQTLDRLSRVATSDHVHRCRAFPADPSRFCLCSHPTGVGYSPRSSNLLHSLGWSLLLSHRSIFTPGHRTAKRSSRRNVINAQFKGRLSIQMYKGKFFSCTVSLFPQVKNGDNKTLFHSLQLCLIRNTAL